MSPRAAAAIFFLLGLAPGLAQDCTFSLSPSNFSVPATETGGIVRNLTISASRSTCARTATANVAWITISFGQSGTGNGTLGFRVDENKDARARTGTINVSGAVATVTQAAANCAFSLNPATATVSPTGGTGTFQVSTTCNWRAETGVDWIIVTSPGDGNGSGNGTVAYQVKPNTGTATRTGTITVGQQQFRITQPAPTCDQGITPTEVALPAAGGSGTVQVTSTCAWSAVGTVPWITITAGSSAPGNGTVSYSVQPNPLTTERTGTITIGTRTFQVRQGGSSCAITLNPTSASFSGSAGGGAIAVTATCAWTATASDSWISINSGASGSGNGTVTYTVAANTSTAPRSGSILIGTQLFPISQSAAGCALTISPASGTVPSRGGSGNFLINAPPGCPWLVQTAADWVTFNITSGEGNGTIIYAAAANFSGAARTASITAGTRSFQLAQAAATPTFAAAGVLNAASFTGGAVAPGLIVTLFGTELGPERLALAEVNLESRSFPTEVGGTQVLFDGVAAPLIYASERQVSAVVPYAVAGRQVTRVEVQARGSRSAVVTMPVAAVAPGVFTQSAQGTGPGAILNQDFTVNGPGNAAEPGSIVSIFATGGGVLHPPGADGRLSDVLSATELPVSVEIDGRPAEVFYGGGAPGLISGAIQVNARIPANARPGDLPLVVRVGAAASQSGVTVSVR